MYYRNDAIRYLQSNNILALKLDHAVTGVVKAVSDQLDTMGAGAKRALYYTSCFTEEYQDVCRRQKNEDVRFVKGAIRLLQYRDVVYDMLRIFFEEILKYRTADDLEHIQRKLLAVNIHIASSALTRAGFTLAVATAVSVGMNLRVEWRAQAGRTAGTATLVAGFYGIVQKAADCAYRLSVSCPSYYAALYVHELEMMYFLVEPLFDRAEALKTPWDTNDNIANIITRMIR